MEDNGAFFNDVWMDEHQKVWVKFKNDEWMKIGKIPRVIGDLGVAASLQGFRICEFLKTAMAAQPIIVHGLTTEFIKKPDHDVLKRVFQQLINPPDGGYFAYFSDDACLSLRINGVVRMFNLDISSCDSSHGAGAFQTLIDITPEPLQKEMIDLIEQCSKKFQIRHPFDPKIKITISIQGEERYVLYSGSVITTLINNIGNLLIATSIAKSTINTPLDIVTAAEEAGYVITGCTAAEECTRPEDLQFLKHSPCVNSSGEYVPILNLGVLIRTVGHCKGDLPGRSNIPLAVRAKSFQSSLLQGMYPTTSTPLINNMKRAVQGVKLTEQGELAVAKTLAFKVTTTSHETITPQALCERYLLTPEELDWLTYDFPNCGFGEIANHTSLDKILIKDYGIQTSKDFRQGVLQMYCENDPWYA